MLKRLQVARLLHSSKEPGPHVRPSSPRAAPEARAPRAGRAAPGWSSPSEPLPPHAQRLRPSRPVTPEAGGAEKGGEGTQAAEGEREGRGPGGEERRRDPRPSGHRPPVVERAGGSAAGQAASCARDPAWPPAAYLRSGLAASSGSRPLGLAPPSWAEPPAAKRHPDTGSRPGSCPSAPGSSAAWRALAARCTCSQPAGPALSRETHPSAARRAGSPLCPPPAVAAGTSAKRQTPVSCAVGGRQPVAGTPGVSGASAVAAKETLPATRRRWKALPGAPKRRRSETHHVASRTTSRRRHQEKAFSRRKNGSVEPYFPSPKETIESKIVSQGEKH